jgi:hypothetical protein
MVSDMIKNVLALNVRRTSQDCVDVRYSVASLEAPSEEFDGDISATQMMLDRFV